MTIRRPGNGWAGNPRVTLPPCYRPRLKGADHDETIDLMEIPGKRYDLAPIHLQATLQEAQEQLNRTNAEALYVQRQTAPGINRVYGILTREMIDATYR